MELVSMSIIKILLNKLKSSTVSSDENFFHNYPFGKQPHADRSTYLSIWEKAKEKEYLVVDNFEKESGVSIDREWLDNLALLLKLLKKNQKYGISMVDFFTQH